MTDIYYIYIYYYCHHHYYLLLLFTIIIYYYYYILIRLPKVSNIVTGLYKLVGSCWTVWPSIAILADPPVSFAKGIAMMRILSK